MFRSVGNRCFVDFAQLDLPVATPDALSVLKSKGFETDDVDIVNEAHAHVGKAAFKLGASTLQAPQVVDCSSFTKWLYGRKGVWIPRLAVQQYDFGNPIESDSMKPGDLVFTSGYCSKAWPIGHVGLFTGQSVITAMIQNGSSGVVELSLDALFERRKKRGVRRIVETLAVSGDAVTLIVPSHCEIETSDDIKYFVLSLIS